MLNFYDLGKPGTVSVMNQILWDVGIERFKTHRTRTVLKNRDKWDP